MVVLFTKLTRHSMSDDNWTSFFVNIIIGFLLVVKEIESKPAAEPAVKLEIWEPNYCNDTKLQESAGLTKTALGQFLGYSCDTTFFHCRWSIDGWKTYKKSCRKGLVYDRIGTQNCNYDFNVEGCGSKQCADCLGDQYACCLSEECVDLGMRCDGKYDCTLEEDEQNCPTCGAAEFPCVLSEQCIPMEKRCNGLKECKDGTDELHCDDCPASMFYCRSSKKCVEKELRCDGNRDCNAGEDEAFCTVSVQKDYVCEDQQHSVPKRDVCNGFPDCPDGSDELYCNGGFAIEFEEHPSIVKNVSPANVSQPIPNPVVVTRGTVATQMPITSISTSTTKIFVTSPMTLTTRRQTTRSTTRLIKTTPIPPPQTQKTINFSSSQSSSSTVSLKPRSNETLKEDYFYEQ